MTTDQLSQLLWHMTAHNTQTGCQPNTVQLHYCQEKPARFETVTSVTIMMVIFWCVMVCVLGTICDAVYRYSLLLYRS